MSGKPDARAIMLAREYSDAERFEARAHGVELPHLRPRVELPPSLPPPKLSARKPPADPFAPDRYLCARCSWWPHLEACSRCVETMKRPDFGGVYPFVTTPIVAASDCWRCSTRIDPERPPDPGLCPRCLEWLRAYYTRRVEWLQRLARGEVRGTSSERVTPKLIPMRRSPL